MPPHHGAGVTHHDTTTSGWLRGNNTHTHKSKLFFDMMDAPH